MERKILLVKEETLEKLFLERNKFVDVTKINNIMSADNKEEIISSMLDEIEAYVNVNIMMLGKSQDRALAFALMHALCLMHDILMDHEMDPLKMLDYVFSDNSDHGVLTKELMVSVLKNSKQRGNFHSVTLGVDLYDANIEILNIVNKDTFTIEMFHNSFIKRVVGTLEAVMEQFKLTEYPELVALLEALQQVLFYQMDQRIMAAVPKLSKLERYIDLFLAYSGGFMLGFIGTYLLCTAGCVLLDGLMGSSIYAPSAMNTIRVVPA